MRLGLWIIGTVFALLLGACDRCHDTLAVSPDLCLPVAAAGTPLQFEASLSCPSCNVTDLRCDVRGVPGGFDVSVTQTQCTQNDLCPNVCTARTVKCEFPSLGAGQYSVNLNGRTMQPLTVQAGGASTCTVSQ